MSQAAPRMSARTVRESMSAPDPTNAAIAALFEELADLYELDGASIHRVLAYRTGARTVREAPRSVAALTREGKVTDLPGIGKTLAEKITALLETGSIPAVEKLRARYPAGLVEMTRLPGLGPKKARKLFDELQLDSLDALREAAENEQLRGVKGFGPKFEASVLKALEAGLGGAPAVRTVMHKALPMGEEIVAALLAHPPPRRSSSPGAPGAGGTPARTSTSSPRPPIRAPSSRRWGSSTSSSRSAASPARTRPGPGRTPACPSI